MPYSMIYSTAVPYGDTFLLVGGLYSDDRVLGRSSSIFHQTVVLSMGERAPETDPETRENFLKTRTGPKLVPILELKENIT